MSRSHGIRQLLIRLLLLAGFLALGYAAYVVIDETAYQAIEHWRLEDVTPEADAAAVAVVEGAAIAEISIARLGLSAVVAEGDSPSVLRRAVGHLTDTALPGQPGNVVLAGHRDTFFRPLRRVLAGDVITLKTRHGTFDYLVESTAVVGPGDVEVIHPTERRTLTLITCFPFSYVGPAPDRFIVRARAVSAPR